jgi:signal-transduction protein with cAMP-binding, CBS, and nucleotidyltransferase domain
VICPCCNCIVEAGAPWCGHCWVSLVNEGGAMPQDRVEWSLLNDPVSRLALPKALCYPFNTPISFVLEGMDREKTPAVCLTTKEGKLAGILTEHDILEKVAPLGIHALELPVDQFMTSDPEWVAETEVLARVVQIMDGAGYRHLPILRDHKPIGIISAGMLVTHFRNLCPDAVG